MPSQLPNFSASNWYSLNAINLVGGIIDKMLEDLQEPYQNLKKAQAKPQLLNDGMVQRAIRVYSQERGLLPAYREQLCRWKQDNLTSEQLMEIMRLEKQVDKINQVLSSILVIAYNIKGKNDMELAMDVLMGNLKLLE